MVQWYWRLEPDFQLRSHQPTKQPFDLDDHPYKAAIDLLVAHRVSLRILTDCNTIHEITVALGEGEMAGTSIEIMPHGAAPGRRARNHAE